MPEARAGQRWLLVVGAAVVLAVASLVSNLQTEAQLTGEGGDLLALRRGASSVLNAASVWAGLLVLAGWLVRTPRAAMAAGVLAGWVALGVHYGLGELGAGLSASSTFSGNLAWFVVATVVGAPLGLVCAIARRRDRLGLVAGLVVPLLMVLEPVWLRSWWPDPLFPDYERHAFVGSAVVLTLGAIVFAALVVRRCWGRHPNESETFDFMNR